ncbi:hypothetical protein QWA68_015540, partial [Fusarium oxysporum]
MTLRGYSLMAYDSRPAEEPRRLRSG